MTVPSGFVTCRSCSSFIRAEEGTCPFCDDEPRSEAEGRGGNLMRKLGVGILNASMLIGVSTTMVACYGDSPDYDPCWDNNSGSYECDGRISCYDDNDCASNQHCESDPYYGDGTCVDGPPIAECSSDNDCDYNSYCAEQTTIGFQGSSMVTYQCVPGAPANACWYDTDCGADYVCATDGYHGWGYCEYAPTGECLDETDCSVGEVCDLSQWPSVCIPAPPCVFDDECGTWEQCINGACLLTEPETCMDDASCPQGTACIDGTCAEALCADDSECEAGAACVEGSCLTPPECIEDVDCGEELSCVEGACVEPGECEADEDCPEGSCVESACVASPEPHLPGMCEVDAQCGGGACIDGMCHSACETSPDCSRTEACQDGLCGPNPVGGGECLIGSDCPVESLCINGFCAPRCDDGDPLGLCSAGEFCDHGTCRPDWRPIAQCLVNADCADGANCVDASCRTACWEDTECQANEHCASGFCYPRP